jgi:hypothetical protein
MLLIEQDPHGRILNGPWRSEHLSWKASKNLSRSMSSVGLCWPFIGSSRSVVATLAADHAESLENRLPHSFDWDRQSKSWKSCFIKPLCFLSTLRPTRLKIKSKSLTFILLIRSQILIKMFSAGRVFASRVALRAMNQTPAFSALRQPQQLRMFATVRRA